MAKSVTRWRQSLRRWLRPAKLAAESGIEPASRVFGFDRGTPIDRRYIESFLARHADSIRGAVLEVADDAYTKRFGGERVAMRRVLQNAANERSEHALVGDLEDPPGLPENAFDCFICTQTYNFAFEIARAVESSHRLLKPGGVLLATAAAIAPISRYDMDRWGDYWRLTTASARRLMQPWFGAQMEIGSAGNAFAAGCFVQGLAVEDLADPTLLDVVDADYPVIITMAARKAGP
jgi:SAM-dependent methyltransferase